MLAVHAHEEELCMGELKLSRHANLSRRHSQLREDAERYENSTFPTVPRATQNLWVRVCRLKPDIGNPLK